MSQHRALGVRLLVTAAVIALTVATGVEAQPAPGRPAPEITAGRWINSEPLKIDDLRGRVVAVEFWTFG